MSCVFPALCICLRKKKKSPAQIGSTARNYFLFPKSFRYSIIKITHPLWDEFQTGFPPKHGGHTQRKLRPWKYFVEKVCIDASLVVFSTPSPLSRNPALKIVRGGVLSYHPIAGFHSEKDQILLVKIAKSIGFCVYRRFYLTWSPRNSMIRYTAAELSGGCRTCT